MTIKDWDDVSPEPLALPYKGTTYELRPVPISLGVKIRRLMFDSDKSAFGDASQDEVNRQMIGPESYDRMVADEVPAAFLTRAADVSLVDFLFGREDAEKTWETGRYPEALAATYKAAQELAQKALTNTESGEKTQTAASTSGTTSRKTASKGKPSSGRKSTRTRT